jgi:HK97 family phage major capsid protein
MNKRILGAAILASLAMPAGAVTRGIVMVRADVSAPEVKALVENLNKAFDEFKSSHTKQMETLKAGLPASDINAKVEKISADLDGLQKAVDDANVKIAAAAMNAGGKQVRDREYSDSFVAHMKRGDVNASMSKGSATDGGYLAPVEWDRTITDKLVLVSPIRSLASVQPISTNGYTKLFNMRGTSSGWVGEADARPATNGPQFQSLAFNTGEIYANPAATQQLLDDAEIDLETWLANEVQTEFARQEGVAFVAGDGTNKPTGILTYVTGGANAAKHPFGAITTVNSGAASSITSDGVMDLIYNLASVYTGNARFTMNRTTQGLVRKLKDGQGNYLWQPSFAAGQPSTLAGYPSTEVPDMPDVAANSTPILFGDWKQTYLVIDRIGVRVLRDPYTNKPYVSFYTTKRVGGGVVNPQPMRALKIAVNA